MEPHLAARLDPRLRPFLEMLPPAPSREVGSRQELVDEAASEAGEQMRQTMTAMMESMDNEGLAPSAGLRIVDEHITSQPDGNTILLRVIRPDTDDVLPCVYYIHGGGMASMSCTNGMYRTWGRLIAHQGVAVVMVDFRNSVSPSSVPEVEPFPAGLNDCVSGLHWTLANAGRHGIDAGKVVVAGESGGGNLTLAVGLRLLGDGDVAKVKGLFALCPYIAGEWPQDRLPSSIENNGILLDLHNNHGKLGYGIEAFDRADPLAWPLFATEADVTGLPPTVISVNEMDPLRDEGIAFYTLLLRAGVSARAQVVLGTSHGAELMTMMIPDISVDRAQQIAAFARS